MLAALETQEWSIIQLFERLSYCHYKNINISAMIRTKLRIRIEDIKISKKLHDYIQNDENILRDIFKIDRIKIVNLLLYNKDLIPLTIDNVIYLMNHFFLRDFNIAAEMPTVLNDDFKRFNIPAEDPPGVGR